MFAPSPVGTVDVGWIAAALHVDKESCLVGLVGVAFQPCQLPLPVRCGVQLRIRVKMLRKDKDTKDRLKKETHEDPC